MITEVEKYLSLKNTFLDAKVKNQIEESRLLAINQQNEPTANYSWCLKQIYLVQNNFLHAINCLREKKYEEAWLAFDRADIELGCLEDNFDIEANRDPYHMVFIGRMIRNYQILFPYRFFLSRESIIKKEKCSICNKTVGLRNSCNHKIGKLYMGEICFREVVDMEFKAFCIVTDPFDKFSYLQIQESEYNYEALEWLMSYVENPYDDFHIETIKIIKPEYKNTGRNDKCPCGSGNKYKKCHCGTTNELMDHNIITFLNKSNVKSAPMRCFKTMK